MNVLDERRWQSWICTDCQPVADVTLVLGCLAFSIVERLSPYWGRNPDVWVFGARRGEGFVDNAKYLFVHVAAEHPEIRPVWISKDRTVVRELQAAGYEAYHAFSPHGMVIQLHAGAICVTQSLGDVTLLCAGGATIVQLWHGIPLKTVGWDAERAEQSWPAQRCFRFLATRVSLLVVPSEVLVDPLSSGLGIRKNRIAVTGYPRTDIFVREIPESCIGLDADSMETVQTLARDSTVIAYLPTFRASQTTLEAHLDFPALDAFLAEHDAWLLIKTHPFETLELGEDYTQILHLPSDLDPFPVLNQTDVLITDYSSVYFDFLLLDRPVVFYPFDLEAYSSDRGFYFEYDSVTPGPRAYNFEELLGALKTVLDSDDFSQRRHAVCDRFFEHPAGTHAERTVSAIRNE
jgi:CDP-glycerol glycerophosphotransferase (TagB/SpsB family)